MLKRRRPLVVAGRNKGSCNARRRQQVVTLEHPSPKYGLALLGSFVLLEVI